MYFLSSSIWRYSETRAAECILHIPASAWLPCIWNFTPHLFNKLTNISYYFPPVPCVCWPCSRAMWVLGQVKFGNPWLFCTSGPCASRDRPWGLNQTIHSNFIEYFRLSKLLTKYSFILTVSDNIMWRLNTKSWTWVKLLYWFEALIKFADSIPVLGMNWRNPKVHCLAQHKQE